MSHITETRRTVKTRIRILCQYFYPETITPGTILAELAEELVRLGCEVEVFAGLPKHDEKWDMRRSIIHNGIKVQRVWYTRFDRNRLAGRILNTATFSTSLFFQLLFREKRTPWLIITEPPFLGLFGWIFKKLFRVPFIFLLHDVFPEIAIQLKYFSRKSLIATVWEKLNKAVLRTADSIVVIGREMKSIITKKLPPEQHSRIMYIPNWANGDLIWPVPVEKNKILADLGLKRKFVVQYSGNMGLTHDLETIIHAADDLRNDDDMHFLFIGRGAKRVKIERMAGKLHLKNVSFLPFQPREKLCESLGACHVALVSLEKPVEGLAVPSKFYGILASGKPVIALMSGNSEIAWAIKHFECGITVEQKDVAGLVSAIKTLKNDKMHTDRMGQNARKAFEENYTVPKCTAMYHTLIKKMCSRQL